MVRRDKPAALITHVIGIAAALAAALAAAGAVAVAAPPPPPPGFIDAIARQLLPTQTAASFDGYSKLFANDLVVTTDGDRTATGKAEWLALERRRLGMVDRSPIAYAEGRDTILVVDRYDDRSGLPGAPGLLFDPRYRTRALRYQIGDDHLIHSIRIVQAEGFPRAAR